MMYDRMTYDRLLGWLNALGSGMRITVVTVGAGEQRGRVRTLLST